MSKDSLDVSPLDCNVVKLLLDKFGFQKAAEARALVAADLATRLRAEAESDYRDYFKRLADTAGVVDVDAYIINFDTKRFEVKPPPEPPKPHQPPADINDPPAPGRAFDSKLDEVLPI